jgi:hypothetical protein
MRGYRPGFDTKFGWALWSNSPDMGWYSLLHHGHSTALMEWSTFLFLSWHLDKLGWFMWPDSFYCLVLRVSSSAKAYLLVMANITSDILEFFMVSLWIKDKYLSSFLKNIIIDLSSTSGMMFLLL